MGVIPWSPLAGGWLSGRWRKGTDTPSSTRARMLPDRYDLSLPGNQRKLEAADALAELAEEAGISLIHLALAFVINHPAVTAAIIGPRTMEQLESQLGVTDITLDDALLDRIDEIVMPATNVNPEDAGWENSALEPAARRR
jgi:aryl-alcohol dehydrogenase-like predicted oxidoreductase